MSAMRVSGLLLSGVVLLSGCTPTAHRAMVQSSDGERVTIGTVQREIRVGMSGGEVASVLGSPNIVSLDEYRQEVWIYDKIATDRVYSTSSGGVGTLILALVPPVGLGGGATYQQAAGASSTSQRTMTIIIKFDTEKKVWDFAYHTSRF